MTLIVSFIVYSLAIVGVGLWSTRLRKSTADDFILANRELGPWASSLSASASAESGWVMLGLVGEAYVDGVAAFWILPGILVGYLFNWFVIADKLRQSSAQSGAATLPQYILHRFGAKSVALRLIPAAIIILAMLGYVAAQMNAAGKAFEATFSLPYGWGVLAGAVIILAYTVTGGFRAICWTDIIQALFMVVALIGMPLITLSHLGGYSGFLSKASQIDPQMLTLTGGRAGIAMLGFVIGMLGIGLGYPGQPHILARFMAARDSSAIRRGGVIALFWMVLVYSGAVFFGLFAKVHFGLLADPEQALPLAVNEFLPPILGGLVVAAIVAAICSTADSQLMVVSSTISRDILPWLRKRYRGDHSDAITFSRRTDQIVLVALAVVSILFAASENRVIFEFVLYAWSVMGAAFGPVLILGLLWRKTNKAGAITGMLTGLIVTIVWRNIPALKSMLYELIPAFVLALLATWLISLTIPNSDKAV
ncbi:MAG: sodium/proline symporter [Candidatus Zixiibacteriota bacterium]